MHLNIAEQNSLVSQSLEELISALSAEDLTKYHKIIRSIQFPNSVFEPYCSWSEKAYTRNCIAENEKFELILLCWEAGQITPIHCHGGEECWVRILDGEIKETIYTADEAGELKIAKTSISTATDVSYMIDFMGYHRLENLSKKRSMSLHLYAKPIRSCNVFDENLKKFVRKNLVYNSIP